MIIRGAALREWLTERWAVPPFCGYCAKPLDVVRYRLRIEGKECRLFEPTPEWWELALYCPNCSETMVVCYDFGVGDEEEPVLMDSCGYPTEAALRRIREWPYKDLPGLFAFIADLWRYGDDMAEQTEEDGQAVWRLHTGGWSGNEDIIAALRQNNIAWALTWYRSERGGHYEFRLPGREESDD